jgi:hypothetical protein
MSKAKTSIGNKKVLKAGLVLVSFFCAALDERPDCSPLMAYIFVNGHPVL